MSKPMMEYILYDPERDRKISVKKFAAPEDDPNEVMHDYIQSGFQLISCAPYVRKVKTEQTDQAAEDRP